MNATLFRRSLLAVLLLLLAACARREGSPVPPSPLPSLTVPPLTATATGPAPEATPTLPATPAARLAAARAADRLGDWPHALLLYGSLRDDPTYGPAALLAMGDLLLRDERPLEAAAAWQAGIALAPTSDEATGMRYRLARGLASVGQVEGAIALFQQVDEVDDEVDDLLALRLADAYRDSRQVAQAVEQRERLYALTGGDRVMRANAARVLGDYHASGERWAEAERWYGRALELSQIESYRAELLSLMARAAEGRDDEPTALARWREIVAAYPATPSALQAMEALGALDQPLDAEARGRLYLANEQGGAAARAFFEALKEADRGRLHDLAAQGLMLAGNPAGAQQQWQSLIDTHPDERELHPAALLGVGRAQAAQGQAAAAQAAWGRVASRYPTSEAAPAALWLRAKSLDTAAAYLELARRYPDDEQVAEALWRAGLLEVEEDPQAARAIFERLSARPEREQPAQSLFWAGKAAQAAGDEAGARAHWRAAVRVGGADYYALRAAVLLGESGTWQPRRVAPLRLPTGGDLSWLDGADGRTLPDDPRLRRGERFLLLGEVALARGAFSDAIAAHAGEPQPLWAMAHHFHALGYPSLGSQAARALMRALAYDIGTAPPPLLALVYPLPYPELLNEQAEEQGLSPTLLAAMIYQESRWEAAARSSASARGLTQVIPDTGRWIASRLGDSDYEFRDLDRPLVSMRYGAYYLDYVLDTFDQNPYHALAAYNAGPGNARRWLTADDDLYLERIALAETRLYVEVVYEHWYAYQRLASAAP